MPRLKTDILELFEATALGKLADSAFELDERYCTTVMLVAGGKCTFKVEDLSYSSLRLEYEGTKSIFRKF